MTEIEKSKRGGGGKASRTEAVGVRLDPKLKYLAELAARHQRRTLSSYIEWAIQDSLERIALRGEMNGETTIADEANYLWDVDDADRFAKLALRYPHLLTHQEQLRWKVIRELPGLWRGRYAGKSEEWTWTVQEDSLVFDALRTNWRVLCDVADGKAPRSEIDEWLRRKTKSSTFSRADDDIPF
jgi:hypothetical protein